MANISLQAIVTFANTKARRMNDLQVANYRTAKEFKAEWDAQGISALIAGNTNTDLIVDGATPPSGVTPDGRPPLDVFHMQQVYNRAVDTITDYEANTNTKLNQANAIAVTTNPLF